MRRRIAKWIGAPAIALLAALSMPGAAGATALIEYPPEGATIKPQPAFRVDYGSGSFSMYVSPRPERKPDGVGFLFREDLNIWLLPEEFQPDGSILWPEPLDTGRYYWMAKLSNYDADEFDLTTPVRRFTVTDEPIKVLGWYLNVRRSRKVAENCPRGRVLRFTGEVKYQDNTEQQIAYWTLTLKRRGRPTLKLRGRASYGSQEFDQYVCLQPGGGRRIRAVLSMRDTGSHVTVAKPLRLRVP